MSLPPIPPPPAPERRAGTHDAAGELTPRLEAARRLIVLQRVFMTTCFAASAALVLLETMAAVDYAWMVSSSLRATWLALVVAGGGVGTIGWLVRWARQYRTADTAVAVEHQRPEYGQRLRTALDYEDPFAEPAPANPALVRALHTETAHVARAEDFQQVAESMPLLLAIGALAAAIAVCIIGLISGGEQRTAAGRTLLLPWEYTTVTFSPDEATVKQGDSVGVTVNVQGRSVSSARLLYRPAASRADWSELSLLPPNVAADGATHDLRGELAATIADCQQDLEFQVVAGPRDLPFGRIRVLQPLVMAGFQAHITSPEYTGREEKTVDTPDLKVMEGSDIAFELRLNRRAAEAELKPVMKGGSGIQTTPAMKLSPLSLRVVESGVRGQLADLRHSATFDMTARAADGMTMSPVRLNIRVQPDGKPQIRFVQPPEELEVTPTTEVSLAIEAADDLGLHRVGIACQVADGPMQTLWEQDFVGGTKPILASPSLLLEDYEVTFHDGVTYYAFAEDHYFGQPRRTSTPLRFVDIRPYKRSYQMLDTGGT